MVSVFVLGLSAGYGLRPAKERGFHPRARFEMMMKAVDKVDIPVEKKQAVREVLRGSKARMREVGKELWPEVRKIRKESKHKIAKILTKEEHQKVKSAMREVRRDRWKRRLNN